ncbi:hypothetical protein N1F78_13720 [Seonamhaeicola sp. MEBiC1930]|uniref:hypothetical protein n=1 Tax=Seonamhaeicola sp. MEBiC01930 TaxID=2976768 RepID=UPI003252D812
MKVNYFNLTRHVISFITLLLISINIYSQEYTTNWQNYEGNNCLRSGILYKRVSKVVSVSGKEKWYHNFTFKNSFSEIISFSFGIGERGRTTERKSLLRPEETVSTYYYSFNETPKLLIDKVRFGDNDSGPYWVCNNYNGRYSQPSSSSSKNNNSSSSNTGYAGNNTPLNPKKKTMTISRSENNYKSEDELVSLLSGIILNSGNNSSNSSAYSADAAYAELSRQIESMNQRRKHRKDVGLRLLKKYPNLNSEQFTLLAEYYNHVATTDYSGELFIDIMRRALSEKHINRNVNKITKALVSLRKQIKKDELIAFYKRAYPYLEAKPRPDGYVGDVYHGFYGEKAIILEVLINSSTGSKKEYYRQEFIKNMCKYANTSYNRKAAREDVGRVMRNISCFSSFEKEQLIKNPCRVAQKGFK